MHRLTYKVQARCSQLLPIQTKATHGLVLLSKQLLKILHLLQVLVLRMQTKGSVEERILEASSQKRSLADRSITGKKLLSCLFRSILRTSCDQPMRITALTSLG